MAYPPLGEDGKEIGNTIEAVVSGTRCTYTAMASLAIRPIRALSCCAMHDAAAGKAAEEQASNLVPMVTFLARDSYYDQASSNMIVGSRRCVCKDMDVRGSTVRGASGQRSFPSFAGEVDRRCLAETRTPDPEGTLDANCQHCCNNGGRRSLDSTGTRVSLCEWDRL